jgi:hypothetical protein
MLKGPQRKVVDKLLFEQCQNPGMLLYHHMGTGKTLNALAVVENMSGILKNIIVVCPKDIKNVWIQQLDIWKPVKSMNKYQVISFDEFFMKVHLGEMEGMIGDETQCAFVVDECHHIFTDDTTDQIRGSCLMLISRSRVRLLLSGTPADDPRKFLLLCHAASGGKSPPVDTYNFNSRYLKVNYHLRIMMRGFHFFDKHDYRLLVCGRPFVGSIVE